MIFKILKIVLLTSCFFLCWMTANAQEYEIYVFNHPFTAKVISKNGKKYVPVQALVEAMKLPFETKDDTLWIGTQSAGKIDGKIILNGKVFTDVFQQKGGSWYVALKPFVEASGNKIITNQETKIIDILPGSSALNQKQADALAKAPRNNKVVKF